MSDVLQKCIPENDIYYGAAVIRVFQHGNQIRKERDYIDVVDSGSLIDNLNDRFDDVDYYTA